MSEIKAGKEKSKTQNAKNPQTDDKDTPQAAMKGKKNGGGQKQRDDSKQERQQKSSAIDRGTPKQQITALLNVYSEQASETDKKRAAAILGFLKNLWTSVKSIFGKKNKKDKEDDEHAVADLNKAEVLKKLVELFQCSDQPAEIATDETLMGRIITEMPPKERNAALDCLYEHVTNPALLIDMIEARFGVTVIDSRQETQKNIDAKSRNIVKKYRPLDWTAAGLVEVYKVYTNLPQSDLDLIKCLMHLDDTGVGGAAFGYANDTTGVYYVNYKSGNEKQKEVVPENAKPGRVYSHSDMPTDRRNNTIMMDMTTAHELGHIVDGHSGWKISGPGSSMRQVSKWEETPDDPEAVLNGMIKSIAGTPYDGALTDREFEIAKTVAIQYLQKDQNLFANKWGDAADAIFDDTETAVKNAGTPDIDAEKLGKKLVDKNCKTNLLKHLWRGQAVNYSCYNHNDAMSGMNRPFHQGYAKQPWFTFDVAAWNDKISCYQFRCPKEEFAETYASYHAAPAMGKKKGEMTPKGLLNWFISEGYGSEIPENGAAPANEEKSGKKS